MQPTPHAGISANVSDLRPRREFEVVVVVRSKLKRRFNGVTPEEARYLLGVQLGGRQETVPSVGLEAISVVHTLFKIMYARMMKYEDVMCSRKECSNFN